MPGCFRSRLVAGDPLRGLFVGWGRGEDWTGPLPPYGTHWTLTNALGAVEAELPRSDTGRDRVFYDPNFHGQVTIPAGTAPGDYTIHAGPVSWSVEVVRLPKRTGLAVADPGAKTATLQSKTSAAVLRLDPGVYELTETIRLPVGLWIVGPGAVIRAAPKRPAERFNCFSGGEWCIFDGVTFEGSPDMDVRPFEQDACPYLTLNRCTFRDCGLNAPGPGLHAERCTFDGGGAFLGSYGGLIRRCRFVDSLQDRYLTVWGGERNLAVVDCHWDRANRGLIMQARWGDIVEPLLLGLNIRDMVAADGGAEGILCEGPGGIIDPLILHYRYAAVAGGGPAIQFDSVARNALIMDAKIGGGSGIIVWGPTEGTRLHNVSLTGGARIQLGAGTTNTNGTGILVSGYHPTASNFSVGHETHTDPDAVIVWDRRYGVGAGNRFEGQFWLAPGIRPCQGAGVEVIRSGEVTDGQ